MLKSRKGISPILATLLLIVIAVAAVIVTYAWVMSFTGTTTGHAGAVLSVENLRYHSSNKAEIILRNSGTSDAKIVSVYAGTSSTSLVNQTTVTYVPASQLAVASGSLNITVTYTSNWTSGQRYYFKVVTEAGQTLPFDQVA